MGRVLAEGLSAPHTLNGFRPSAQLQRPCRPAHSLPQLPAKCQRGSAARGGRGSLLQPLPALPCPSPLLCSSCCAPRAPPSLATIASNLQRLPPPMLRPLLIAFPPACTGPSQLCLNAPALTHASAACLHIPPCYSSARLPPTHPSSLRTGLPASFIHPPAHLPALPSAQVFDADRWEVHRSPDRYFRHMFSIHK